MSIHKISNRDYKHTDKRRVNTNRGASINTLILAMRFTAYVIAAVALLGSFLILMLSF